ncbi:hypothetical protein [Alteromonas sp. 14N.309.X.WAT.G.H12]|uniref:hypothetical protein n=1 Tax=Alteromonas sp. 14N.309.X.WAT.G.H12 TaxID=3120824 RepID=UPI002FD2D259
MRIKSKDDINKLGLSAKKQIEALLKQQGGFNNQTRPSRIEAHESKGSARSYSKGETKRARVMHTANGLTYCPWPSTDPFVALYQQLEAKYGRYNDGGMLLTELIIDGGTKDWRFDFALISPFRKINIADGNGQRQMLIGYTCLVEADGFGFHRSKDAFKNDRAKQTHALKQGFVVKRVTNEDVRKRLHEVMEDIAQIVAQPRLYKAQFAIRAKGRTQSVLNWVDVGREIF